MKTVNINASTNSKRIPIGRCEDNEATRVVFDCSGFSSAYGSGQATLLHRRSKEKISYIVQNITQEDDTVTWTVSSDDTAFSGEGTLQLMWTVNDVVAHSVFYTTITDPSLTDSSSEPTEVKSALQLLIDSCYTKEETDDLIAHMRAGSDWDANEGEDGYIENRPFYAEGGELTKIFDGFYSGSGTPSNILVGGSPFDYDLVDGEYYRVEYEHGVFDCVASVHPLSNMVMIGNGSAIGGEINPEYDFTIFSSGGKLIGSFIGSYSISMYTGNPEIVHKLDSKYLDGKLITIGTGESSETFNDIGNNYATGQCSHCEGLIGATSIKYEGMDTSLMPGSHGKASHVEGVSGRSSAVACHSEGYSCIAHVFASHAEGDGTSALGSACHSEGAGAIAFGDYSHSEGLGTIATSNASHAGGKYNIEDTNKIYAEIIGNGTSKTNRSNARTLDWNGNESLAGSLTLGMGTADKITITPAQLAKLLGLVKENHWESNFMIPDGYIQYNSPKVYTESEASALESASCAVYYLPEEIDLDAMSSLEVVAYASSSSNNTKTYLSVTHKKSTPISDTNTVLWSNNCKGIASTFFAIVKASSFKCSGDGDTYEFPSNVKTIVVYIPMFKPTVGEPTDYFIQSISLDWTPST